MKALALLSRTAAHLRSTGKTTVIKRSLFVGATHHHEEDGGPWLQTNLDRELRSAFLSGDHSTMQTQLAEVKRFSANNSGSIEVVNIFESMLNRVHKQFQEFRGPPAQIAKHPLCQLLHSAIQEAVALKHWVPTKTQSYRTLLKLSQDPETAEEWLRLQRSYCTTPLNRHDFTAVIQAWAHSDHPNAADKAEALITELRTQYEALENRDVSMKPTEGAYIGWITCLSKSADKIAGAAKANRVLEDIISRAQRDQFQPGINLYNAVLNAWAKAGQPQNAETMLRDLCEKAFDPGCCMPDQISFTTVIDAWAKSGRPEAPDRAEELVVLLQQFSDFCFKRTTRANAVTLTAVMNCWAKSSRKEAPERASEILRQMILKHREGSIDMRPTLISFNTCMNAWARSGHASSPEEVERLFRNLADFGLKPDSRSFLARIDVWGRVRRRNEMECADKALQAFEEMKKSGIPPSVFHYDRLLITLSRSSDGHRAQAILEHMIKHSKPTAFAYNCVLSAWARQCSVEGASHCERILDSMKNINIVSFNTAIGAWGKSKSPMALQRAEDLLQKLLDLNLIPDSFTLTPILRLISESLLPVEEKRQKSDALLKIAAEHGVALDQTVIRSL